MASFHCHYWGTQKRINSTWLGLAQWVSTAHSINFKLHPVPYKDMYIDLFSPHLPPTFASLCVCFSNWCSCGNFNTVIPSWGALCPPTSPFIDWWTQISASLPQGVLMPWARSDHTAVFSLRAQFPFVTPFTILSKSSTFYSVISR